ncbi:MAG: hypothetical protein IJ424_05120 [Oscillospiraceae bacterium]|nr:hypothetical protein [Oscillospiraceae bacterium]
MRVNVKESSGKRFNIAFPSGLIFNPVMATISCSAANRAIEENTEDTEIKLTPKQMRVLFKALNEASKQLKRDNLPLVEVVSEDGENVTVIL